MKIYPLIRFLLFRLDPELAHRLTMNAIRLAGNFKPTNSLLQSIFSAPHRPIEVFGMMFSNPIGLAAGYDKDGTAWRGLSCVGFSHIEVGTVTPRPQPGNPRPRLFRLPEDHALINRMGFPGKGADFVSVNMTGRHPKSIVLGINIGKNKDTPLAEAEQDYVQLLRRFAPYADYLTINVSSPNTIGLRQLQERQALDNLLRQVNAERNILIAHASRKIPILVKLSPDLSDSQLADALEVIQSNDMDGVIATNTTLSRDGLISPRAAEDGGLSGKPLFPRSFSMVEKINKYTDGKLPIVGVGGITCADDVQKMLDAGAVLVQIYTALVYEGPGLIKQILVELNKRPLEVSKGSGLA